VGEASLRADARLRRERRRRCAAGLRNVVKAEPPQGDALREEASALARVVADASGRPSENVHVIYEPAGRDRVVFGGGD
jgi:hypothetical protein